MDLRKKYIEEKKLSNLRILHRNKKGEGKITIMVKNSDNLVHKISWFGKPNMIHKNANDSGNNLFKVIFVKKIILVS